MELIEESVNHLRRYLDRNRSMSFTHSTTEGKMERASLIIFVDIGELIGDVFISIAGSSCNPAFGVNFDLLCHPNCCSHLDCCSRPNYLGCKVVGRQFDLDSHCHRHH